MYLFSGYYSVCGSVVSFLTLCDLVSPVHVNMVSVLWLLAQTAQG